MFRFVVLCLMLLGCAAAQYPEPEVVGENKNEYAGVAHRGDGAVLAMGSDAAGFPGVSAVAFAALGEVVAVVDDDGRVHVRRGGRLMKDIVTNGIDLDGLGVTCVSIDDEGGVFCTGGNGIHLFLNDGREEVLQIDSADQRTWTAVDARTRAYGTSKGDIRWRKRWLRGHGGEITALASSLDGRRLVSTSKDHTARLWDLTKKEPTSVVLAGHWNWVGSAAFSADGTRVVTGSYDGTARVWRTGDGWLIRSLAHDDTVVGVAATPDGIHTVSGARHRKWAWPSTEHTQEPALHDGAVYQSAISPDARWMASVCTDHTIRLWETSTGRQHAVVYGHTGTVTSVAFAPDSSWMVTGSTDRTARIWSVPDGKLLRMLEAHEQAINFVAVSTRGDLIATGGRDDIVWLWNASTGKTITALQGHTDDLKGLAFSPDGRWLASASDDADIRLWSIEKQSCEHVLSDHGASVHSVAFSPDGTKLASGSLDHSFRLWDPKTGKCTLTVHGFNRGINTVDWHPTQPRLAAACSDGIVRIVDANDGSITGELERHGMAAVWAAWCANGELIASASSNAALRLDEAATRQTVRTIGVTPNPKLVRRVPGTALLAPVSGPGADFAVVKAERRGPLLSLELSGLDGKAARSLRVLPEAAGVIVGAASIEAPSQTSVVLRLPVYGAPREGGGRWRVVDARGRGPVVTSLQVR